jgi:hypothetical protein
VGSRSIASRAIYLNATANEPPRGTSSMSNNDSMKADPFNRSEHIRHEGKFDLVPSPVAETYIRHDQKGDRTRCSEER